MSIRDRILARADLAAARDSRDLDALAAGLNSQPDLALQPRYITARTILAECADGANILTALDAAAAANTAVKYAVRFLGQDSGLDIGNAVTQGMLDALVPSVLTADQAGQVKAMAMLPVYVTRMDVNAAMFNPDGTEK
jgi:hypothetical protein